MCTTQQWNRSEPGRLGVVFQHLHPSLNPPGVVDVSFLRSESSYRRNVIDLSSVTPRYFGFGQNGKESSSVCDIEFTFCFSVVKIFVLLSLSSHSGGMQLSCFMSWIKEP